MQTQRETALITGASSGIGEAFAVALAQRGRNLVVAARNTARLNALRDRLQREHGVEVTVVTADLATDAGMHAVERAVAETPSLSLVVNNAGFATNTAFTLDSLENTEAMIRVHVLAVARIARVAAYRFGREKRGGIINVASFGAIEPIPVGVNYGATKAYVIRLSQLLAHELMGSGVHVQALCPGYTHSEIFERAGNDPALIPKPLWMSAEAVVEVSLGAIERGFPTVVVPGLKYKLLGAAFAVVPVASMMQAMSMATDGARVLLGKPRRERVAAAVQAAGEGAVGDAGAGGAASRVADVGGAEAEGTR